MTSTEDYLLLYHGLSKGNTDGCCDSPEDINLVVTEDNFVAQIQTLTDHAVRIVSLDELLEKDSSDGMRVVMTFDDGNRSDYEIAFRHLQERSLTAIFYVIVSKTDTDPRFLTSTQLREMHAAGMEIGSHTFTHPWLPLLNRQEIRHELRESKQQLEQILQAEVKHFCLPGGHYNRIVLEEARAAGYQTVASCHVGSLDSSESFVLPRIEVRRRLTPEKFLAIFDPLELSRIARLEGYKSLLRRSLGLRFYTHLRGLASRLFTFDH